MSRLVSTTEYIDILADLDGAYTLGEDVYLDLATMKVTNDGAVSVADIGVIGELQEAPTIPIDGLPDRMVIRLTVSDDLLDPIKRILNSQDV